LELKISSKKRHLPLKKKENDLEKKVSFL